MKTLLITAAIILFLASCTWLAKKEQAKEAEEAKEDKPEISTELDSPIDFGYKTNWLAVKTNGRQALVKDLNFKNSQPCNWQSGINEAYLSGIFITPQIGDWTLVVGRGLPEGSYDEGSEKLKTLVLNLSEKYGEVHYFGTHRVVEYQAWMKATNGQIDRAYFYLGERGENGMVEGEPTEIEADLNLFNSLSEEAKDDAYWEREDFDYVDEQLVMKIAESWSVNPTKLSEREDIEKGLGVLGLN